MKIILILLMTFLLSGTNKAPEKINLENNFVLYGSRVGSTEEIILLDLSNKIEYKIFEKPIHDNYLLFKNDNILMIPQGASFGHYLIYNFKSNVYRKIKFKLLDATFIAWGNNFRDSLLIYTPDSKNIYLEEIMGNSLDSIKLNLGYIYNILCNDNGYIAVLFTNDDNFLDNFKEQKELIIINIYTKEFSRPDIKPVDISGWSPKNNQLMFSDSVIKIYDMNSKSTKFLEYLMNNSLIIDSGIKFINDSTLIFSASSAENSENFDLFKYGMNSNDLIKISSRKGVKVIYDTYLEE